MDKRLSPSGLASSLPLVGPAADIGAFEVQPACSGVNFAPAANVRVGRGPQSVTAGDFNGDGKLDLAVVIQDSETVSVLIGDGGGGFTAGASVPAGSLPHSLATADFNGDGKLDLAVVDIFDVAVRLGDGVGGFAGATNFAVGASPFGMTTSDFNADGKVDIAVTDYNSDNVSVLLGNGAGGFTARTNFTVGDSPRSVAFGDFNEDGNPELVVVNAWSNNLSMLFGDGAGGFATAVTFTAGASPTSVAAGDFDGDGKPDLGVANFGSSNASVLLGDGIGGFEAPLNFGVGLNPEDLATGDFNGDGKLDLATANFASNNVSILLNTCTSNSAPVANDDARSTFEDTPLAGTSVLANDADGENDTLSAVLVDGPANAASFTLNSNGTFTYMPNANFNGTDSFTYKANDGSLDSNIATVTITVNAVNDAPVASATPAAQTVQYSDAIAPATFTASDIDSSITTSTTFNVDGGSFSPGLPNGLMLSPFSSGAATLTGTADVPAGVYIIRFTATDGSLSTPANHTLTVNKERTATEYTGDIYALTAGPNVTTANVRLAAQLTQEADGSPGDITKAKVTCSNRGSRISTQ